MSRSKADNGYSLPSISQLSLPIVVSIACILLWLTPDLSSQLEWSRQGLNHGEWWRLVSGHLLHSNAAHLWMNVGGLWLIFALFQPCYTRAIWLVTLMSCLFVGLTMFLWVEATDRYVGLSAVLHGLFTWGALKDIEQQRYSGWLLLIGVVIKVGWENLFGASADTAALIEAKVAVESHLLGVLAALVCFAAARLYSWVSKR